MEGGRDEGEKEGWRGREEGRGQGGREECGRDGDKRKEEEKVDLRTVFTLKHSGKGQAPGPSAPSVL